MISLKTITPTKVLMDGTIFKEEICTLLRLFLVFFLVEIGNQLMMGVSRSDFVKQVLRI